MTDVEPRSKPTPSELLNHLGPILATAFDKGFSAFIREWPTFAVGAAVSLALGYVNVMLALIPPSIVLAYWGFRSFANAARLFEGDYRMHMGDVARLIALGIVYVIVFVVGVVFLVVPAIWLCNKLSLAMVSSLRHGRGIREALAASWDVTTGRFWETVLFNVVVNIAGSAVAIVAELFATIALATFSLTEDPHKADQLPTGWLGVLFASVVTLYLYAVAFAQQAIIMCQRMWLAALRGEPLPVKALVQPELLP